MLKCNFLLLLIAGLTVSLTAQDKTITPQENLGDFFSPGDLMVEYAVNDQWQYAWVKNHKVYPGHINRIEDDISEKVLNLISMGSGTGLLKSLNM